MRGHGVLGAWRPRQPDRFVWIAQAGPGLQTAPLAWVGQLERCDSGPARRPAGDLALDQPLGLGRADLDDPVLKTAPRPVLPPEAAKYGRGPAGWCVAVANRYRGAALLKPFGCQRQRLRSLRAALRLPWRPVSGRFAAPGGDGGCPWRKDPTGGLPGSLAVPGVLDRLVLFCSAGHRALDRGSAAGRLALTNLPAGPCRTSRALLVARCRWPQPASLAERRGTGGAPPGCSSAGDRTLG